VPPAVDDIPVVAQALQPGAVVPVASGAECCGRALGHPLGPCRSSRVDADPAAPAQPYFAPGVGVRVAQQEIIPQFAPVAALVTSDHAGRDVGGVHQYGEGRGIVLAKAFPRVEEEIVHAVAAEWWWRQRI